MEARVAIWVVADPRPEHVRAISWLNESAPADFYLLKMEGIRIGASPPAPLLTLIVGPSEESREAGEAKKDRAERYHIRRRFWTQLLERARAAHETPRQRVTRWLLVGGRDRREARTELQLRDYPARCDGGAVHRPRQRRRGGEPAHLRVAS
jgi:hypothetical protein